MEASRQELMIANPNLLNFRLSEEDREILLGSQGPVVQKVMETVVAFGEALGAECLIDIEGPGHLVIPWSNPGISPPLEMLEELVAAGLKTRFPFTLDPRPPLDFENLYLTPEVEEAALEMFANQERYDKLIILLGLRDQEAYTCTPYQREVGNIPEKGAILAWSESACAIHANSVYGARTNRNGAIMDLLLNIIGKAPLAGLLTDDGRRANWLVEVKCIEPPNPQLLGTVIGLNLVSGVPYITGLDSFLDPELDAATTDYLHEMGTMLATYSAVSLYHIENITPEAVELGRGLLSPGHKTIVIDQNDLDRLLNNFPVLWNDPGSIPQKAFVGCPHLSIRQIYWWAEKIKKELADQGKDHLGVETILFAAPQVLKKFREDEPTYQRMITAGVRFSAACCECIFETGRCNGEPFLTNSNKLRAYTSARYFPDEVLIKELIKGGIDG